MSECCFLLGASMNCYERLEYKAEGARETGVYMPIHEDFEHRQRSNHGAE